MAKLMKKVNIEVLEKVIFDLERELKLIKEDVIWYNDTKELEAFITETVDEAIINTIFDNVVGEDK